MFFVESESLAMIPMCCMKYRPIGVGIFRVDGGGAAISE